MMETVVFYLPTISPIPTVLKEKNRDKTISRKQGPTGYLTPHVSFFISIVHSVNMY